MAVEERIEAEWATTGRSAEAQRAELEGDLGLLRQAAGNNTLDVAPIDPEDHPLWHRMLRDAIEASGVTDTGALLPEEDAAFVTGSFDPTGLAETLREVTCGTQAKGLVLDATDDKLRVLVLVEWPAGIPDFVSKGGSLQQLDLCRPETSVDDVAQTLVALSRGATPAEALRRRSPQ